LIDELGSSQLPREGQRQPEVTVVGAHILGEPRAEKGVSTLTRAAVAIVVGASVSDGRALARAEPVLEWVEVGR
jgi:hypothetical protein